MTDFVGEVLDTLAREIEIPDRPEDDDVLGVLVRAILSQATSSQNRDAAFGTLLDTFSGDFSLMVDAELGEIADAIRVGGLAAQKSKRLHKILSDLKNDRGSCSLEFLRSFETQEAVSFLNKLPGVGPQTATFTAGWALGADLCPINTGVRRVSLKLGLVLRESDAKMHAALHAALPEGRRFEAHQLMVRHARLTCGTVADCAACCLSDICRSCQIA